MLIEIDTEDHPDMDGFQFCLKAMMPVNECYRMHLKHLLIKDGYAVSTDGSRLHRYKCSDKYDDGLYRIFKIAKWHIILFKTDLPLEEYPKYEDLFEVKDGAKKLRLDFYKESFPSNLAVIIRAIPGTDAINPKYLMDLEGYFDVFISSEKHPIVFKGEIQSAAIMLMRGDE